MKVAVTDACIFIDLIDSEACTAFFQLQLEIITTRQVWMELDADQRSKLEKWKNIGKLRIVSGIKKVIEIRDQNNLSKSLSIADLSVWTLTANEGGILLTSDGTLRKMAQQHRIETHALLWIFDQLVKNGLLPVPEAIKKLQFIFYQNTYYKSDSKLYEAYETLLTKWQN